MGDPGGKDAVEAKPYKAFDELMHGEERRERREEEFAAMTYAGQGDDADARENSTAHEVRGR
jgi:hypothetical protein